MFCSLPPVHLALLPFHFYSRLRDLAFTPGSFSITRCPCAGHQMTTQPPEERSSSHLLIWAAACSPPARSARGRTTSACLREGGVRGPLCPSVSGSYWPVTPSSTYYSVQGERRIEKTSRGKTSEWEREVRKTFSWILDALLFVPDCPTDTCNRFYPPMFTL